MLMLMFQHSLTMIGSRSKYYNKLQYNTDSSRVASDNVRVRVIQGLRHGELLLF